MKAGQPANKTSRNGCHIAGAYRWCEEILTRPEQCVHSDILECFPFDSPPTPRSNASNNEKLLDQK